MAAFCTSSSVRGNCTSLWMTVVVQFLGSSSLHHKGHHGSVASKERLLPNPQSQPPVSPLRSSTTSNAGIIRNDRARRQSIAGAETGPHRQSRQQLQSNAIIGPETLNQCSRQLIAFPDKNQRTSHNNNNNRRPHQQPIDSLRKFNWLKRKNSTL